MKDFSITLGDVTKVSNGLLWQGIVRANDEQAALSLVEEQITTRVARETGLPHSLIRVISTEIVPHLRPDLVEGSA